MTVKNVGDDVVTWLHDGCAIAVAVWGEFDRHCLAPGGRASGQVATFKDRLVDRMPKGVQISFAPEGMLRVGRIGCADTGIPETIPPGRSIRQRARWDGMAFLRLGLPPTGPVTIQGWAGYYYRGKRQPSNLIDNGVIRLETAGWIVGGKDPSWLDPPEIIDAALRDSDLVDWISTKTLGNGVSEILWFDLDRQLWQIGTLEYGPDRLHYVLVDPATGAIIDTVERHWDPDVDGYP